MVIATSSTMKAPSDLSTRHSADLTIATDPAAARRVQKEIERQLRRYSFCDHDIFSIKLALEEALVNAIKHGNQLDRGKKIHIAYHVLPGQFDIHITDEGCGFDPCDVPDPTAAENLERPCGRGLMLMRHYMTQVTFNPAGNCVSMSKVAQNGRP